MLSPLACMSVEMRGQWERIHSATMRLAACQSVILPPDCAASAEYKQ